MSDRTIAVMICWARSGGTLLNRILVSHPDLCVLSEVNPRGCGGGSCAGIKAQAHSWYEIQLGTDNFAPAIRQFVEQCSTKNKRVVIRDWTVADFPEMPEVYKQQENRLGTIDALKNNGLRITPFALVRNAVDVWLSQRSEIESFGLRYKEYVNALCSYGIPIFRYEDLCSAPELTVQSICEAMHIPYTPEMMNFAEERRVNGDIQLGKASRGFLFRQVRVIPRRRATQKEIVALRKNANIRTANDLLGYSSNYREIPRENFMTILIRRAKFKARSGV